MKASICYLLVLALAVGCNQHSESPGNVDVSPHNFLSSDTYSSLVIEIVSVSGLEPTATAIDNLKNFLQTRINKTGGITVTQSSIGSPGKSVFTLDDIKGIESSYRKQKTAGTTLTAFLFLADGDYSGNSGSSKILGLAYGTSSMVLFEKTVREFSGGVGKPSVATLETVVMDHEFGHVLGLVNNGTALQSAHQDTANGRHCNVQSCLMYYNVETSDIVGNLLGGSIPGLDANCIADLQGNGGK